MNRTTLLSLGAGLLLTAPLASAQHPAPPRPAQDTRPERPAGLPDVHQHAAELAAKAAQLAREGRLEEAAELASKAAELLRAPAPAPRRHLVRAGETLHSIAQRYFDSPEAWKLLADANGIEQIDRLRVGQELLVPLENVASARGPAPPGPAPEGKELARVRAAKDAHAAAIGALHEHLAAVREHLGNPELPADRAVLAQKIAELRASQDRLAAQRAEIETMRAHLDAQRAHLDAQRAHLDALRAAAPHAEGDDPFGGTIGIGGGSGGAFGAPRPAPHPSPHPLAAPDAPDAPDAPEAPKPPHPPHPPLAPSVPPGPSAPHPPLAPSVPPGPSAPHPPHAPLAPPAGGGTDDLRSTFGRVHTLQDVFDSRRLEDLRELGYGATPDKADADAELHTLLMEMRREIAALRAKLDRMRAGSSGSVR